MVPQLYIMLKEPHPGRVKTRLGRDIGMVRSASWFRHQSQNLIRSVGYDKRWQTVLAVSPDVEGLASRVWPSDLPRWPQGDGNLGDRMRRIMRETPKGPVIIIGADIPDIQPYHIARAFGALGDHQAVFGPAMDGGFWLVGLKRVKAVPPRLFDNVRWSSQHALGDSIATLTDHSIALVDQLRDVDTASDLA